MRLTRTMFCGLVAVVLTSGPAFAAQRGRDRGPQRGTPVNPAAVAPQPISGIDFANLRAAIERENLEDQKRMVLATAMTWAYFTVRQVGELVDLFAFSSGKIKVLEITYGRVVDPQNAYQLYSRFPFDSDRKQAETIIGSRVALPPRAWVEPRPISDIDFANLKAAIRREGFAEQKRVVLASAATWAYFTVRQVGELVDLFPFSSDKIKVLEITYGRVLDLQNADQLYSRFPFDSDRRQVAAILGR